MHLVLTTHDSGGLTVLDLALAAAIDRMRPAALSGLRHAEWPRCAGCAAPWGQAQPSCSSIARAGAPPRRRARRWPRRIGHRPVAVLEVGEQRHHVGRIGREERVGVRR